MLPQHLARPGTHLGRRQRRGIVNEQFAVLQLADSGAEFGPILFFEATAANPGLVDFAHRRQHPHHQLGRGHLHTEHQHRLVVAQQGIFHQIHREGGFTHRRTGGDDNQVGLLQARGHFVELFKTGTEAGDGLIAVKQLVDLFNGLLQQGVNGLQTTGLGPLFGDLHDAALGLIEHIVAAAPLRVKAGINNGVCCRDQGAECRALAHRLSVGADIGNRGRCIGHLGQITRATHLIQFTVARQGFCQRDHIDGLLLLHQALHAGVDATVLGLEEITLANQVRHRVPAGAGNHQATQHRLLCFQRVGRAL